GVQGAESACPSVRGGRSFALLLYLEDSTRHPLPHSSLQPMCQPSATGEKVPKRCGLGYANIQQPGRSCSRNPADVRADRRVEHLDSTWMYPCTSTRGARLPFQLV